MAITFTGDYDPNNWALTNSNSDGSVNTSNATAGQIILTGGDNNLGNAGTTDWTITIANPGTLTFDWSFTSVDSPFGDDSAGYLFNGVFTSLATNTGDNNINPGLGGTPITSSSTITIPVVQGNTFGFRVQTSSNAGGPGVFTVNNFQATPVPFGFDSSAMIFSLGIIWGVNKWRKNSIKK